MKPLKLGFLYNLRHIYPDAQDPRSQKETDFDDQETIDWMIKHLREIGCEVFPIEVSIPNLFKIPKLKGRVDLVLNYSEGFAGVERLAQIPALLEALEIPYTGSSVFAQSVASDKSRLHHMLTLSKLNTPDTYLIESVEQIKTIPNDFPYIVKPCAMGSSAGITNKSVVRNSEDLTAEITNILRDFQQPAIVQKFLTGREFSVGFLGNPLEPFPIIEVDHSTLPSGYEPLDSLEVKWVIEEQEGGEKHFICPAILDDKLKSEILNSCQKIIDLAGFRDFCRIDLRCDEKDKVYILDINSPCGLLPPEISTTSYFPLGARVSSLDYNQLLKSIINTALTRYKMEYLLL